MKNQRDNQTKKIANDLAQSIYANNIKKDEIQAILKQMPYKKKQNDRQVNPDLSDSKTPDTDHHVGIWKKDSTDEKLFVRDPTYSSDFIYWSDTQEISAKKDKIRIVFMGESVARGYLLDPEFNPCISLRKIFEQIGFDIEIIDLARTNCSIGDLKTLSKQCLALDPDGIVIFGGNNWIINSQNAISSTEIADIINDISFNNSHEVFKQVVEGKLEDGIADLFESLKTIKNERNIPVFVINPEFNLLDWHSNEFEQIPLFHTESLHNWYECLLKGKEALTKKNYTLAKSISSEMIELYPTNPLGYEMLAECMLQTEDVENARKQYRLALSTTIFQTSHCPGATSFIQEKIRKESNQNSFHLIDLPDLFKKHLDGGIPGRSLFLDYCHLTVEGMNVSMLGLAKEILGAFESEKESLKIKSVVFAEVNKLAIAKGHFLAAIHNAHWGQNFDVIYHHCKMALSAFDISKEMLAYTMSVNSTCPWRMNKNFEDIIAGGVFSHYLLLAQQEDGVETLDILLTEAILKVLYESNIDKFETINRYRISEHFSGNKKVDLLKSQYWSDFNYNLNMKLKRDTYYTEFFQFSKFHLICEKNKNLHLELVHKIPNNVSAPLEIELNGTRIANMETSGSWSKEIISLPHDLLIEGMNSLRIYWPHTIVVHEINDGHLLQYADVDLLHKCMYPVIGEIHSLSLINADFDNEQSNSEIKRYAVID